MKETNMNNYYTHLECSLTGEIFDKNVVQNFNHNNNQPLIAKYNLDKSIKKNALWEYNRILKS